MSSALASIQRCHVAMHAIRGFGGENRDVELFAELGVGAEMELPNELRGMPCVNNLHVLNGICWVLRPGALAFIRLASIRI